MCSSTMPATCSGAREITAEGLERTFALNHMSYFVLTHCLRERLVAAAPVAHRQHRLRRASAARRSISTTCRPRTATGRRPPMAAPSCATSCSPANWRAGSPAPASTANCLHPGFVATNFGQRDAGACSDGGCASRCCSPRAAEPGAEHHRPSRELAGGRRASAARYFYRLAAEIEPSPAAQDDAVAAAPVAGERSGSRAGVKRPARLKRLRRALAPPRCGSPRCSLRRRPARP